MRHHTAIFLVVVLAFASSGHTRAAAPEDAETFRNPIEWLLNDIGKLLNSAASKVTQSSDMKPEEPVSNGSAEPETVGNEPAAPKEEATPLPPAEEQPVAETPSFRNPLSWLFSDLARFFKPDLEIEQSPPPNAVANNEVAPEPASETSDDAVQVTAPLPNIAAETEVPSETTQDTAKAETPHNPISWLFHDLARLFTNPEDEAAPDVVADAEAKNPAESDAVASPAPVSIAAVAAEPEERTFDAQSEKTADVAIIAPETIIQDIEIGPWVPHPENDLFNPNDSLFSSNGTPLLATPKPAPEPEPVQTAAVKKADEQTVIRTRPPYRPENRNHAVLGDNHKAVTPDPVDDSIVDRVLESLFGIDEPVEAEETIANKVSDRIVPEENLDLGYTSPDAQAPDQTLTRLEDGPLTQIDLYIGKDNVIGTPYDAATHGGNTCIERALHGSVFCLQNLDWPTAISASFAADTAFLLPGEGVVRYENGKVSRVYSVFKAADFAKVVKFMQQRFGPPQEREIGWMHMLEAPKLPNTTFRWQALSADQRDAIVLEVRNYDDLRRSFADMDHGMVRLYRKGSRPVFKHISTMDLMLLQRRRVARAPVEVNAPPKQN
ncbi:MAG: hypothetical protein JJ900_02745 [Rhodospirillales bacterium]|nr:hypothetical protein [Rhodospirillales bacterium]MBO6785741.1 hypothetical protein [Rhodospirillales bacterium]